MRTLLRLRLVTSQGSPYPSRLLVSYCASCRFCTSPNKPNNSLCYAVLRCVLVRLVLAAHACVFDTARASAEPLWAHRGSSATKRTHSIVDMPTPPRILDYVRDGDVAAVQAWVATGTRQDARDLFWDLLGSRRVDFRFISLLLDTGFFTLTKAEYKAVLQAIGQAAISDTPRKVRRAAEAILGAPEGSLDARKVLIKEVIDKVLSRTAREHINFAGVAIEAAKLDGTDGVQIEAKYLVRAAGLSNASVVRELCSRGAKPNHVNEHNWTALHTATQGRHVDIVVALLDFGGEPNLRVAPEGEFNEYINPPTPLMCAAASSHSAEMVRVLLSRGADFSATNATGRDAEAYARAALDRPTRDEFPDDEDRDAWGQYDTWRLAGEAERIIELLTDVRSAGSWKHYTGAWRIQLLLLQRLCSTGRAFPVTALGRGHAQGAPSIEDLEATSGCKVTRPRKRAPPTAATEERPADALMARLVALPSPLVGKVASYWHTARDPLY